MKAYTVHINESQSACYTVEAENEKEAAQIAFSGTAKREQSAMNTTVNVCEWTPPPPWTASGAVGFSDQTQPATNEKP